MISTFFMMYLLVKNKDDLLKDVQKDVVLIFEMNKLIVILILTMKII